MNLLTVAIIALVAVIALALTTGANAASIEGGPDRLADTRSLGDLIGQVDDRPVHIVYVHGMRAEGPGAADKFRAHICESVAKKLGVGCKLIGDANRKRHMLNIGKFPEGAAVLGTEIWRNESEWNASQPFVDRFVYELSDGKQIIIDEVNWWPLLFPIKCRMLLIPEANLSGADKAHLKLCAKTDSPFFPWVSSEEIESILSKSPKSGGGAWANAWVKREIMNWGLSDAVLALGPMSTLFHEAMEQAFTFALTYADRDLDDQAFVVISESLGSFVVLDAIQNGKKHVRQLFDASYDLYFMANQVALLDLGRIENLDSPERTTKHVGGQRSNGSVLGVLQEWASKKATSKTVEKEFKAAIKPESPQIITFNDPSDMLTYDMPRISGATVVNIYTKNGCSFLGLIESPSIAHTAHMNNTSVLDMLFERRQSSRH